MPLDAAAIVIQNLARRGTGLPPLPMPHVTASGVRVDAHHVIAQSLLPDRPAHATFATREEADAEWERLRSHPSYAGVLDPLQDLLNLGTDLLEGIQNGIAEVVGFLVDTVLDGVQMLIQIAGKTFEILITAAAVLIFGPDEGPRLASAFFSWLGARFNDLLAWLGEKLSVKDAWDTMVILNQAITQAFPATAAAVQYFEDEVVEKFFESKIDQAHKMFGTLRTQLTGMTLGQCLPAGTGSGQPASLQAAQFGGQAGTVGADQLTAGPATWFTDKIIGSKDAFAPHPNLAFLAHPEIASDPVHDLKGVWDTFCGDMEDAGTSFGAAVEDLRDQLQDLLQLGTNGQIDQAAFAQVQMTRLLDIFENLIDGGLKLADAVCKAALNLVQVVITNIGALLSDESWLAGGFIETLFTWIYRLANPTEQDAPKVTPLQVGLLAVSFPLVWVTKATQGDDAVPFPHGFPTAPAEGPDQVTGGPSPVTYGMWVTASVAAGLQWIFGLLTDTIPVGEAARSNSKWNSRVANVCTIVLLSTQLVLAIMEWPSDNGLPNQSPFNSSLPPDRQALRFADWVCQYWVALGLDVFCSIYSFMDPDQPTAKGKFISLAKNMNTASNIVVSWWSGVCAIISGLDSGLNNAPYEGWFTDFVPNVNGTFQFLRMPALVEESRKGTWIAKIVLDLICYTLQIWGCAVTAIHAGDINTTGSFQQSAPVNSVYPLPPSVTVSNDYQMPVTGIPFTFTLPDSGAGGTFPDNTSSTGMSATASASTDANGVATAPPLTANGTAGDFSVQATASVGTGMTAVVSLHNFKPNSQSPIAAVSGGDQHAAVTKPFAAPLVVKVTDDQGNGVANVQVDFQAPWPITSLNNATAAFPNSAAKVSVFTGSDGNATTPTLTANGVATGYTIEATVTGIIDSAGKLVKANFQLTNDAPL
jgi:hypothetical protein